MFGFDCVVFADGCEMCLDSGCEYGTVMCSLVAFFLCCAFLFLFCLCFAGLGSLIGELAAVCVFFFPVFLLLSRLWALCWLFVPCFVPPLCVVIAGLFIEDGVLVTKD